MAFFHSSITYYYNSIFRYVLNRQQHCGNLLIWAYVSFFETSGFTRCYYSLCNRQRRGSCSSYNHPQELRSNTKDGEETSWRIL
ncbi:uncharacterized protein LOC104900986 isoform X2 [Beta vulgaris subsp. vulgaris]|uniref:uncharacterized protein LOC104900986 isoform X2 n=1 Tax=Beta vulgaris subsp. vulgaris TaxID=3555 RepID=UPI0005400DBF|nr:uncharacterized protein LOC104900986 isoform X2 [Beta vulgaris subsp. vulgaris]